MTMKWSSPIAALCFALAAVALSANAQQPKPQPSPPVLTIRLDTDLVTIDVTALDQTGNYVRNLRAEEFQLYEDGQRRELDFFSVNDQLSLSRPLAVVFALDLSGSLRPDEAATLRQAALKFTELMKGNSVFAALTFNHNVKIIQNFTSDAQKLEQAFARLNQFGGATRIYDAIDRAVTMLARQSPSSHKGRPVRRVVIVITDGFDSASIVDRGEVIKRAQEAGVTVYSITLPSYALSAIRTTERVLTPLDASRIVPATGGRDFPADAHDFTPIFKTLAEELRASYALAYYSRERDGKYHQLRVTTTRPGVQLRVNRTGYTAPAK